MIVKKKVTPSAAKSKPKKATFFPISSYPATLLAPIGKFLTDQIKRLEKHDKNLEEEDPFSDSSRIINNASPDTEAAEQFGHARSEALQKEIHRKLVQTRKALTKVKLGTYGTCESCGQMIDTDRLVVYPEAILCVACERKKERKK